MLTKILIFIFSTTSTKKPKVYDKLTTKVEIILDLQQKHKNQNKTWIYDPITTTTTSNKIFWKLNVKHKSKNSNKKVYDFSKKNKIIEI